MWKKSHALPIHITLFIRQGLCPVHCLCGVDLSFLNFASWCGLKWQNLFWFGVAKCLKHIKWSIWSNSFETGHSTLLPMCPTDGIFPCGKLIPSASWWWLPPDRISCEVLAMMNVVTGVFVESALGSAREDMHCTGWSIWEKTSLLGQNNFTSIIRCADKVVRSKQSIIHTTYKLFVVPALCSECPLWPGSWTGGRRGGWKWLQGRRLMLVMLVMMVVLVPDMLALLEWHILH